MSRQAARKAEEIKVVDLGQALSERYLAYALSTITSRSLPDVRDGLKPVQRRILYAMLQLRLDPAGGFKKCARVVGDVIGKFHPHGDQAVYDALVRLAQDFAQRYPLVDGQGNFGNVDGDNAAAMRYTESRLTPVAMALLDGIDEDAVDFRATYDGSEREPVVLPAAFPNLLANGSAGIAVGMATSIPPHNAGELLSALAWMAGRPIGSRQPTAEELLRHVKGPDLPTGGVILDGEAALVEAYRTGRGSFRLRAHYEVERLSHGQYQVVVTEMPYQVQKSRLVERIAELLNQKKLPFLADVRDESAETIRLVLVPRSRTVEPEVLMEQLFRGTDLEVRLGLNMNVLDAAGVPRVMSLAEVLDAYLAHRMEVLVRRSKHRLAKVEDRLEVLEGYLKAFLDLDEVIRIIREEDEPKAALMRRFELTDRQAEAILNLRLRNLRRLEEMELTGERDRLLAERADLESLLGDEGRRRARLKEEFQAARKQFGNGASASAAPGSPRRPRSTPPLSRSRSSATPSRSSARGWAGFAPSAARSRTRTRSSTRRATPPASSSRRRAPTSCCSSPPTDACSRSPPTSCRAAAARASRSRCWSTSGRAWSWRRCASTAPRGASCSPPRAPSASWHPRPSSRRRPRPASRWSTSPRVIACSPSCRPRVTTRR